MRIAVPYTDVSRAARLMSLLRLLLVAIGLLLISPLISQWSDSFFLRGEIAHYLQRLFVAVAVCSGVFAITVRWIRSQWHLQLFLLFDLLWIGCVIYLTGGVMGPAVPVLFALVLCAKLVLPSYVPFLIASFAAAVLLCNGLLYMTRSIPTFDWGRHESAVLNEGRIIANLAVQIAAVFFVDWLMQILAQRLSDQFLLTNELLTQLGEGVLVVDGQGRSLYRNKALHSLLEIDPDAPEGLPLEEILHDSQLQPVLVLLEHEQLPANGRLHTEAGRVLSLRVQRLQGRRGKVLGRALTVRDETRIVQMEREAEQVQRMAALGEMAAGIAHEVRNPLASLRGCAQEIAAFAQTQGQSDVASLSQIVVTESDRLDRVVHDFLDYARMRPPNFSACFLSELFSSLDVLYARDARINAGIELQFIIEESCPPVLADMDQLHQLVVNLVTNAIDVVHIGGVIRIEAALAADGLPGMPDEFVRLRVQDNGPGIPRDKQEQIFTPFFSAKSQGTGLGLTLVQRIVALHHAHLRLKSEPGCTQFDVYWPIAPHFTNVV